MTLCVIDNILKHIINVYQTSIIYKNNTMNQVDCYNLCTISHIIVTDSYLRNR